MQTDDGTVQQDGYGHPNQEKSYRGMILASFPGEILIQHNARLPEELPGCSKNTPFTMRNRMDKLRYKMLPGDPAQICPLTTVSTIFIVNFPTAIEAIFQL